MAAYLMRSIKEIKDPAAFAAFQKSASSAFANYGGKFLLNSQKVESLDGDWAPMGLVIVEIVSYEDAKSFFYSPENQAAIGQRLQIADSAVILVNGS
jgi:uncharacterized protein (DUF1330 family)